MKGGSGWAWGGLQGTWSDPGVLCRPQRPVAGGHVAAGQRGEAGRAGERESEGLTGGAREKFGKSGILK
jgi:hypothetical protein